MTTPKPASDDEKAREYAAQTVQRHYSKNECISDFDGRLEGFKAGLAHEREKSRELILECAGFIEAIVKNRPFKDADQVDAMALNRKIARYKGTT